MSNRGRKNLYNPNDDAPDPRLVIPNLRDEFHAVFKDLDLAEVDLRPILPASAKIVPGQPSCKVLKVVLEAASDDDLTDLFRRLWYLSPKLGKLHQFTSVQLASYFRGVEICNFLLSDVLSSVFSTLFSSDSGDARNSKGDIAGGVFSP